MSLQKCLFVSWDNCFNPIPYWIQRNLEPICSFQVLPTSSCCVHKIFDINLISMKFSCQPDSDVQMKSRPQTQKLNEMLQLLKTRKGKPQPYDLTSNQPSPIFSMPEGKAVKQVRSEGHRIKSLHRINKQLDLIKSRQHSQENAEVQSTEGSQRQIARPLFEQEKDHIKEYRKQDFDSYIQQIEESHQKFASNLYGFFRQGQSKETDFSIHPSQALSLHENNENERFKSVLLTLPSQRKYNILQAKRYQTEQSQQYQQKNTVSGLTKQIIGGHKQSTLNNKTLQKQMQSPIIRSKNNEDMFKTELKEFQNSKSLSQKQLDIRVRQSIKQTLRTDELKFIRKVVPRVASNLTKQQITKQARDKSTTYYSKKITLDIQADAFQFFQSLSRNRSTAKIEQSLKKMVKVSSTFDKLFKQTLQ